MINNIQKHLPFFLLVFIYGLGSCNSTQKPQSNRTESDSGKIIVLAQNQLTGLSTDSAYSFDTTLIVQKDTFQIQTKDISQEERLLTAVCKSHSALIDTISSEGLMDITFSDFNKDGNSDITLIYGGNNATYFLYLFDPASTSFRNIEEFVKYPAAVQLKSNPKYYYSYHRAGCADLNWVSDLFKIEKFKAIQIGHIEGKGCDFDVKNNPQEIKIYKVTNTSEATKRMIERLPYMKYIPSFDDKWEFIERYWNKNYRKFE